MTIKPEKPPRFERWYSKVLFCILAGFLAVIAYPSFWGVMNYSGMCIPERTWLTHEEKIDRVLKQVDILYREDDPTTPIVARQKVPLSFTSVEQFHKDNPTCCKWLKKSPRIDYYSETIGVGIGTLGSSVLDGFQGEVVYLSQTTKDQTQSDIKSFGYFNIDNCGKIPNGEYIATSFHYYRYHLDGLGEVLIFILLNPFSLMAFYFIGYILLKLGFKIRMIFSKFKRE